MIRLSGCRRAPAMLAGVALLAIPLLTVPSSVRAQASARAVAFGDEPRVENTTLMRPVTIRLDGVPLKRAVAAVAERAGVRLQYQSEVMAASAREVSLDVTQVTLGDAFARLLRGTNLEAFSPVPNVVTIQAAPPRADGVIVGTVTHAKTRQPVAGATVLLDGATNGVATANDGTFRITVAPGEHTITVRAMGFLKRARVVSVAEGQTQTVDVTLEPSASVLNEVIVTGTVIATERKAIPTPITVISAEDIEKRGITRIDQLFRGEVPGVTAIEKGSSMFSDGLGMQASSQVYVRGSSSLSAAATPLKTYVDGVELLDASYLGTIDPKSIERIEIITGPQAATIYGSGAMSGVMQIFTKKGIGRTTPDLTVALKYGVMQSNISDGLTPQHNDAFTLTGGAGALFSYTATASYLYTGQWIPKLYARTGGVSLGATYTQGPVTTSATMAATIGQNGTWTYTSPYQMQQIKTGEWRPIGTPRNNSGRVSKSSAQTTGLNLDYRVTSSWQHHLTLGRNQTTFDLKPEAPAHNFAWDSLYRFNSSTGQRTTAGYNTTYLTPRAGPLAATVTLGLNGTTARQSQTAACGASADVNTYIACASSDPMRLSNTMDNSSWGAFGSWQLGLWDRLYLTFALRGERNPSYGRDHSIDWTPTNGISYTMEYGNLTLKMLGSYGRATRMPDSAFRDAVSNTNTAWEPSYWVTRIANPLLTPEYERGPQGGIELYYGNVGSLTINHYRQTVTDLIQNVQVDSFERVRTSDGLLVVQPQTQYQNVASLLKRGWEGTASLNIGPVTLRGTYSWNDSRISQLAPQYRLTGYSYGYGNMFVGSSFNYIPTHNGSMSVGYARGATTVWLVNSYTGSSTSGYQSGPAYYIGLFSRLQMYADLKNYPNLNITKPGYVKSDLSVSQRLTPWASATLNVTNLGNSYGSQYEIEETMLGRQTQFGLSLRFPRTR